MAFFVGLPKVAGLEFEAGEPAFGAEGAGIDADVLCFFAGEPVALDGVPANHEFSREMRLGIGKSKPCQLIGVLFLHGEVRVKPAVDVDCFLCFVVREGARDEAPMGVWNGVEISAVGFEGFESADAAPVSEVVAGEASVLHDVFVVSFEGNELGGPRPIDEIVDDPFAIGPAINVVPEHHNRVFFLRFDGIEEGYEGGEASVDVSDGKFSLHVILGR